MRLAAGCLIGLLLASGAAAQATAPSDPQGWQRVVGILQYLESDYGAAIESGDPFELEEQRSFASEAIDVARELGPRGAPFVPRLEALSQGVTRRDDPSEVAETCRVLIAELIAAGGLPRGPRRAPDLERGAQVYATACAACHGAEGRGDTEIAATLKPPPTNFHDPGVLEGLSAFKAFNAITFGITGTAMPGYPTLTEDERWAVSFYLFAQSQPECTGKAPRGVTLEELSSATNAALAERYGSAALPCLRRSVPTPDAERAIAAARAGVAEALRHGAAGHRAAARDSLLDAYLSGFEPIEPLLGARDSQLVKQIEEAFLAARVAADREPAAFAARAEGLQALLERAQRTLGGKASDFWSVFTLALLILLREGFEATVVVAALLAALKKLGQPEQARVVHFGWSSALLVGAAAFLFARTALSGADREWVEGVTALVAVGMLLYAALWLNARANIRVYMGELRGRMQSALGKGSLFGLFVIAFTAALRESLETALFLQGLSIDSPAGVAWGAGVGAVLLVGLVLAIGRVGYRLPMKTLFNLSTVVLVATAVMLLGKGLRALQEVGALPMRPLPTVQIDLLGIYPDALTLVPQLLLALAPLAWWALRRVRPAPPQVEVGKSPERPASP